MARIKTGIAIEPVLWKEFKKALEERGLSTCFVLETLIQAWLAGTKAPPSNKVHPSGAIVVNQTFQRVVKRERRKSTFSESEYKPEDNFYNPKSNFWEYRLGPCNLNGHVAGCACSQCRE